MDYPNVRSRTHGEMQVTWIDRSPGLVEWLPGMRAQPLVNNGILFTWKNEDTVCDWKQQYVETDTFNHSIIFSTDGGGFDKQEANCGKLINPFVSVS